VVRGSTANLRLCLLTVSSIVTIALFGFSSNPGSQTVTLRGSQKLAKNVL
jgi:hypothetical protein